MVDDEEGNNKEVNQEIHCLGDTVASPHLTQITYEEYLMCNQLNELSKGEKVDEAQNKYNLRSKQKDGKPSTSTQPKKLDTPSKVVVGQNKETGEQNNHPIIKSIVQEIKEIQNPNPIFILRMKSKN